MYRHLAHWVDEWEATHVLVVGDLILDRYVWGTASTISEEAPVPIVQVTHEESRLGAAGAVVAMARALGPSVTFAGVVGKDAQGAELRRLLTDQGFSDELLLPDATWRTTVKTRIIARAQHVCRVDHDPDGAVSDDVRGQLLERVKAALDDASVVSVEDYNKGLFSPDLLQEIIGTARTAGLPVLVDPWRHSDFSRYRGASLICPNRMEAGGAVGRPLQSLEDVRAASEELLRDLELDAVLVTLGGEGSTLLLQDGSHHYLRPEPRAVFDITGAGDMTLATLAAAVAVGAPFLEAAQLAGVASGLQVERLGTAVVTREELLADLQGLNRTSLAKVLSRERLAAVLVEHRRRGETVVFTNGCFDLLHPGHVKLLESARNQGDVLVVALNTDESVQGLKGPGRPALPQDARARMVASLGMVDYVTLFGEPTPQETIELLKPDVLVKGEDWKDKGVVGREFVESYGGRVVLAPLAPGHSTSELIDRIRSSGDHDG